jgi:hypothetical protein
VNKERPNDKLPYKGAWLWVGAEMIHLMELPNPDPVEGRPEHGGRDRCTSYLDPRFLMPSVNLFDCTVTRVSNLQDALWYVSRA